MATYYVKNGGNDSLDGLSDANAWSSISKVNSSHLGGDTVLFKQGSMWRLTTTMYLQPKSGNITSRTIFSSYTDGGSGAGTRPLFLGSKQENSTSDWVNVGGNLWENTDSAFATQVGNIIFNNESSCGVRILTSTADLDAQGEYFWDPTLLKVTLYSSTNPASYYSNIECALYINPSLCYIGSNSYITLDNLAFKYGARHAVLASGQPSNITVRKCLMSYIGGGRSGTLRLGNGIEFWGGGTNILIEKNHVRQIYDSGITNQYMSGSATVNNFVVKYNLVEKCDFGIEFWQWTTIGGSVTNVYFQNNTFVDSGKGWSHSQKNGNFHGEAIYFSFMDNISPLNNIYVRNNILYNSLTYGLRYAHDWALTSALTSDNNLFYLNTYAANALGTEYTTLTDWQNATIHDDNSVAGNPLFTNESEFDYSLLNETSIAINVGVDVGYTDDYNDNPITGLPDIGAFEYLIEDYGVHFVNTTLNKLTTFPTVTIGTQTWMARNWDWKTNGAVFPASNEDYVNEYGTLFTWDQAVAIGNSVPGWRLPTLDEFIYLQNFVGQSDGAGYLKESGTTHWITNTEATNSTGFTAIGSGTGSDIKLSFRMWSSTESILDPTNYAYTFLLTDNSNVITSITYAKINYASIRLIKE